MASGIGGIQGDLPCRRRPGRPTVSARSHRSHRVRRERRRRDDGHAGRSLACSLRLVVGAVFVLPLIGDGDGEPEPAAWDPRVQDLVRFVEAERGLTFEHPVPVDFLTPEQFREELTTEAADMTPKDRRELRASEAIIRALGLLDGDIDLLDEFNTISPKGSLPSTTPRGSGSSSPTDRSRLRYGPRSPTSSRMRSRTSTTT